MRFVSFSRAVRLTDIAIYWLHAFSFGLVAFGILIAITMDPIAAAIFGLVIGAAITSYIHDSEEKRVRKN